MFNEKPISNFETRTRKSFFQSCVLRQEGEFLNFSLLLRDENEKSKIISQHQAGKDEASSQENFAEQEFSLVSGGS